MQRALPYLVKSLIVLLALLSAGTAAAAGYARLQGLTLLSVQTGSMQPAIEPGDAVLVRQRASVISPGDIISFHSHDNPEVLITHRVVSVDAAGRWRTKGDASQQVDAPVTPGQLVGKVERVIPVIGYGFDFIRHPAGLLLAVHVPAIALVSSEIRRLTRYYDARRYQLYRQLRV